MDKFPKNKETTPLQAAETHADLIKEHVKLEESRDMHQTYFNEYESQREERAAWLNRIKEATSLEEVDMIVSEFEEYNSFDDDGTSLPMQKPMWGGGKDERMDQAMRGFANMMRGDTTLESIHERVNYETSILESMQADEQNLVNRYQDKLDTSTVDLEEYADKFGDKLHTAARAMAALDGVEITQSNSNDTEK